MYMSESSTATENSPPVTILPHEHCKTHNTCERGNRKCVSRHNVNVELNNASSDESCEQKHVEYSVLHSMCKNTNSANKSNYTNIDTHRDFGEIKNEEATKREGQVSAAGETETVCVTDSNKSNKTLLADDVDDSSVSNTLSKVQVTKNKTDYINCSKIKEKNFVSNCTPNTITTSESLEKEQDEQQLCNRTVFDKSKNFYSSSNNNNNVKKGQRCYSQMSHVILGEILTGDDAHSRDGSRSPELLCIPHVNSFENEQLKRETQRQHKLIDPLLSPDRIPYIVSSEWTYSTPHDLRPAAASNNNRNTHVNSLETNHNDNSNNTWISCDKHKQCTTSSWTVNQENTLDDITCSDGVNDGMHDALFDTYEVNDVENAQEEDVDKHTEEQVLNNCNGEEISIHNEGKVQYETKSLTHEKKESVHQDEPNSREHMCHSSNSQNTSTEHTSKRQRDKRQTRTMFRKGMRVKGRWGCGWFPATVSEDERNGYVQLCWDQDSSYLHLRVKEVRLLHDVASTSSNNDTMEKRKNTRYSQLNEVEKDKAEASIVSLLDDDDDETDKVLKMNTTTNDNKSVLYTHKDEEESITKGGKATQSCCKSNDNSQLQLNKDSSNINIHCKVPLTASQLVSWMEEEDVIEESTTKCSANLEKSNVIASLKCATPNQRKKRCRSASEIRTHHTITQLIAATVFVKNNSNNNNKHSMNNEANITTKNNLRASKQSNRSASQPPAKRKRAIDDSSNVNNSVELNHDEINTSASHLDSLYSIIFDKHNDLEHVTCKENNVVEASNLVLQENHLTCASDEVSKEEVHVRVDSCASSQSKENEKSEHVANATPEHQECKQEEEPEQQQESPCQKREENEICEMQKQTNTSNDAPANGSVKKEMCITIDDYVNTTSTEYLPPAILSNDLFQEDLEVEQVWEKEELQQEEDVIPQEYQWHEQELNEQQEQAEEEEEEEEQEYCVERPQVIESEDYYFCLPQPANLSKLNSLHQGHTNAMPKINVVQNVGLGRVMSVQLSKLNKHELQHETERYINSSSVSEWTVTMRTYETSQITLQHNPVSNELESQTRVYLSNKEITIPVSCLLFNIPVYVIDAAMMKHVYILDEPPLTLLSQTCSINSVHQEKLESNYNVDNDVTNCRSRSNNVMTHLVPTSPERFHASTIPVTQSTRACESFYGTNCNTNINNQNNNNSTTLEYNYTNLEFEKECEQEVGEDNDEKGEMWERESKSNSYNKSKSNGLCNETNDSEENEDSILMLDPRRTTALPHECKCVTESTTILNNNNNNTNYDNEDDHYHQDHKNMLSITSLSSSSSTLIPRAFHSRFTLPATFTPRHGSVIDEVHVCGLVIRDGSLVRFRHHYWSASNEADMSTSENQTDTTCVGDTPNSSFQAQLQWGKVQMMRRVNDSVALVVHTQAANSVFGGSKMCVITPDMIVDVITY